MALLLRTVRPRRKIFGRGSPPSSLLSNRVAVARWLSTTASLLKLPALPVLNAIASHNPASTAIVHYISGRRFTYGQLLTDVCASTAELQRLGTKQSSTRLNGQRIAFLAENSYDYVVTLLSIFSCHAIALPLSPGFPASETKYILNNSQASILLASGRLSTQVEDAIKDGLDNESMVVGKIKKHLEQKPGTQVKRGLLDTDAPPADEGGLMLYTSGTTSRPKGVLLPQSSLTAQTESLIAAWDYTRHDHLLHLLPLHHIHGLVNAVLAPLFAGSAIEFLFPFNPSAIWSRLAAPFVDDTPEPPPKPITFLTAVPTIYSRLLSTHSSLNPPTKAALSTALQPSNLRLPISGSAPLPTPIRQAFASLSNGNNTLLERYGMTETGMSLSCGLSPSDRVDSSVGWPLPGVEARLVASESNAVIPAGETDQEGEIQLRGPGLFSGYWRNPAASDEAFVPAAYDDATQQPWFKTGDIAVRRSVPGAGKGTVKGQEWARGPMWFILGRQSVDIIKTGGEKVSALEVEREILALPEVKEVVVVGVESERWGEKVAAVVVLDDAWVSERERRGGKAWGMMDLRRGLKGRLAAWKVPQIVKVVSEKKGLKRNAMGKVNKKALVAEVFSRDRETKE